MEGLNERVCLYLADNLSVNKYEHRMCGRKQ